MDDPRDLRLRARKFMLACLAFVDSVPRNEKTRRYIDQLLGASSGMSFNYQAARRARSRAEFIAKLGIAVEEADESLGWLEVFRDGRIKHDPALIQEAHELVAILTKALETARRNYRNGAR